MTGYVRISAPGYVSGKPAETHGLAGRLEFLLLASFTIFTFVGTHPFADPSAGSRADGSPLDRLAVLFMFALSLYVFFTKPRATLKCFAGNLPLFFVVAFCMTSIIWSDYPGLTLRRGMLLILLTGITMGIAASVTDLRRMHTILFASLVIIILINLVGTVAMPSIAISDIGVRGLYTQKNVAGIVAMITVILGISWIIGASVRRERLIGFAALAPVVFFLVITRSKTSINLTALGVFVISYFALAEKYGPRFILISAFAGLILLCAVFAFFAISGLDFDTAMNATTGDASFSGRDELWAFAKREAAKRFWLGYGYGAFWDVGITNDPLVRVETGSWLASVEIGVINQAHDGYLELWLNAGRPIVYVATLAVASGAVSAAYKAIFGGGDRQTRATMGGLSVLLFIHLLHNMTEATLFARGAPFCSMVFLALFIVAREKDFTRASAGNTAMLEGQNG